MESAQYEQRFGTVAGEIAEIYIASDSAEPNVIVWTDPQHNILFCISAPLEEETLLKMAQSVQPSG